ncbi:MAG: YegP family protein [Deltaproteobacteria bacterium]|nr:YegP family protein [Deltaproteobacteria bacterium]
MRARNGRVIGTSEVCVSRSNAERAVQSIIALLPEVELL